MNIRRFLHPAAILLALETSGAPREEEEPDSRRFLRRVRDDVLRELIDLLAETGQVGNPSRLFTDLLNREKRAPTALGSGVAMPHVRTIQAKSFIMAFGRSATGLPRRIRVKYRWTTSPFDSAHSMAGRLSVGTSTYTRRPAQRWTATSPSIRPASSVSATPGPICVALEPSRNVR